MAKELTQRILGSVQSGLNSTVHSLQAAVQNQTQGSAFYPATLDQLASPIFHFCLYYLSVVLSCLRVLKKWEISAIFVVV